MFGARRILNHTVFYILFVVTTMLVASCSGGTATDDLGRNNNFSAVVADDTYASHTGREIMRAGGNAVDAMIGMLSVVGVSSPGRASLAGAGQCMVWQPGDTNVTLFRFDSSAAPATDLPLLQTMVVLHDRFGNLPWRSLISPSVRMAEAGVLISPILHEDLLIIMEEGKTNNNGFEYYIPQDTNQPSVGKLVRNSVLARTLQHIGRLQGPFSAQSSARGEDPITTETQWPQGGVKALKQLDNEETSPPSLAVSVSRISAYATLGGWSYFLPPTPNIATLGMLNITQWTNDPERGVLGDAKDGQEIIQDQLRILNDWSNILQKHEYMPSQSTHLSTLLLGSLDYFGTAISCVVTLGHVFGTAEMHTDGYFVASDKSQQVLANAGQWLLIDPSTDQFISMVMSSDDKSVFPASQAMIHSFFQGLPLRRSLRQDRLSVSSTSRTLYHENDLDIKTHNTFLKKGYNLVKEKAIGNVVAIFCPAGMPRDVQHTICMSQADIRRTGSGYVRLDR